MEILSHLADGFLIAFEPQNLVLMLLGCAVGLFIGAIPGLGSVNGVAILLPLTFIVPPTGAIIFLAAIYYGAMYGGAVSSIMLGIPGASTAVATTFDGRPMALKGQADRALITAATASFIGGTISVILSVLLDVEPVSWAFVRFSSYWAAITRLVTVPIADGYAFSLRAFNELGHLLPLGLPPGRRRG